MSLKKILEQVIKDSNLDFEIKNNKLIIKEKENISENIQDLNIESFIKLFDGDANIENVNGGLEVSLSNITAQRLKMILLSVYNNYNINILDAYKLQILEKDTAEKSQESKEIKKDSDMTLLTLAKNLDDEKRRIFVEKDHLNIYTDEDLVSLAENIDKDYQNLKVEIKENYIKIRLGD